MFLPENDTLNLFDITFKLQSRLSQINDIYY